jgi:hypothetical protein
MRRFLTVATACALAAIIVCWVVWALLSYAVLLVGALGLIGGMLVFAACLSLFAWILLRFCT